MNYYLENLNILSEKFPELYLLFLAKNNEKSQTKKYFFFKKNKEVNSFFEEDLNNDNFNDSDEFKNVDTLVVYKLKLSNFNRLKKFINKKDKKLFFIEDNFNNLYNFFKTKQANDFLKNENVSFLFFQNKKQVIDKITSFTKSKKLKVITLSKVSKKFEKLKNEILQKNLISFFSNHDSLYSFKIFKNFYSNLENLKKSFLVNNFENKLKNKPAIILGAGPSLKYSFEKLKQLKNKALIIAGGSAITCLSKEGILPHLGVMIDPNFEEYKRMKDSLSFEIPLIFSTRVNKGIFKVFNGEVGYVKAGIAGFFEAWLDAELKIRGKYLSSRKDELALSVTTVCLMLAKSFGCTPIILDGLDLAYSENKLYASNIENENSIDEKIKDGLILSKDKWGKNVYTNLNWEIESKWISYFIKENKDIKFINATKKGLKIENILDLNLNEIEEKYLKKDFDYRSYVYYLIRENKLLFKKDLTQLKISLKNSLERCISYLEDIIKKTPEYKAILAKEEMSEEIAYKYFLFQLDYTLNKFYENSSYEKLKEAALIFLKEINNFDLKK